MSATVYTSKPGGGIAVASLDFDAGLMQEFPEASIPDLNDVHNAAQEAYVALRRFYEVARECGAIGSHEGSRLYLRRVDDEGTVIGERVYVREVQG